MRSYPVIDVSAWKRGDREPGGDEAKAWFEAPSDDPYTGGSWLFKPPTTKVLKLSLEREARGDSPDEYRRGEDWAEKISFELAVSLGLPAASTDLAHFDRPDGTRIDGSMSLDMRPPRWVLVGGAVLLGEIDPLYEPQTCRGHNLDNIERVLSSIPGPPGTNFEDWSAFDVFAGYLVLDAWIANRDRHEHNWALLQSPEGAVHLSPTFDHGSALGSGAEDKARVKALSTGVLRWCERGTAWRFEGGREFTLVELATDALRRASTTARNHWIDNLAAINIERCQTVVGRTPRMSDLARTFAIEVLTTNQERMCNDSLRAR